MHFLIYRVELLLSDLSQKAHVHICIYLYSHYQNGVHIFSNETSGGFEMAELYSVCYKRQLSL